jgi:hypothetical protein
MRFVWILAGAICGVLSLLLKTLGEEYGNLFVGLLAWALFACLIAFVTRQIRYVFQFIGATAFVGTLLMVLVTLPFDLIAFLPGGEEVFTTVLFAYLSRAAAGGITGLILFYLWTLSGNIRPAAHPMDDDFRD